MCGFSECSETGLPLLKVRMLGVEISLKSNLIIGVLSPPFFFAESTNFTAVFDTALAANEAAVVSGIDGIFGFLCADC